LTENSKSVKDAAENKQQSGDWLDEQTVIAAQNLLKRPLERRGPYVLSDEDLNQKFSLD
jgi:hypothetical protein